MHKHHPGIHHSPLPSASRTVSHAAPHVRRGPCSLWILPLLVCRCMIFMTPMAQCWKNPLLGKPVPPKAVIFSCCCCCCQIHKDTDRPSSPDKDHSHIWRTPHDHHMCASYHGRAESPSPLTAGRDHLDMQCIHPANPRPSMLFPGMCAAHPLRVKRGLRWRAELALPGSWLPGGGDPALILLYGGTPAITIIVYLPNKAILTGQQPQQLLMAPSLISMSVKKLMAVLSARLTAIAPAFGTARPFERCHAKLYERSTSDYLAISNLKEVCKGSNSRPRHYLSHARPFASLFRSSLRCALTYRIRLVRELRCF